MIDTVWYATNPTITTYKRINELTDAEEIKTYQWNPKRNDLILRLL